jgi:hypothetical protein
MNLQMLLLIVNWCLAAGWILADNCAASQTLPVPTVEYNDKSWGIYKINIADASLWRHTSNTLAPGWNRAGHQLVLLEAAPRRQRHVAHKISHS